VTIAECARFDPLNSGWRLESNFSQLAAVKEAVLTNETDRFWNVDEAKSTALRESVVQQMRYPRWTFEIESYERSAFETLCGENSYCTINTKSFGRAQISNHFATVSPHQTIIANQKVRTVHNKRETIALRIETHAIDEFD
jgi:hypothetical protein